MRRVLLLALVAAPALPLAQSLPVPSAGRISFGTDAHSSVDEFINSAECAGGRILVRWDVEGASTGSSSNATTYTVYAHNATTTHTDTSTGACPKADADGGDTALRAKPILTVDATESNPGNSAASLDIALDAALIVSVSGKSCSATANEDIVLCVQGDNGATARGKAVLSTQAPNKATGLGAGSGSGALNVVWTAPTGSPQAEYYFVEASFAGTSTTAIDPTLVPTVRSGNLTATSFRLEGLVNTVVYNVRVHSFSTADNESVSDAVQGMPELANGFWDSYRNAGGKEEGGCGVGSAGPIGILLAAAAIAVRRRRS
jgi:hypothetical protein